MEMFGKLGSICVCIRGSISDVYSHLTLSCVEVCQTFQTGSDRTVFVMQKHGVPPHLPFTHS